MKCEICHKADAETAIRTGGEDSDEELYVCHACAREERLKRQKKSQRTRKLTGLPPGVSMSITGVGGEGGETPPFIEAIMDAFSGMVSDIQEAHASGAKKPAEPEYHEFPVARAETRYRIGDRLHLEGLHLIGELDAVRRALRALDMELSGVDADGVKETGHVYRVRYSGRTEQAKRVVEDLLREERNARVRLFEEMPRVFGDSLCRALAILKNCRLLSPAEFFDLLSPLRLAACEKMLDGITFREIERMLAETALDGAEDRLEPAERDRVDSERADQMNRRFEDVVLNERAEEKFL